RLEAWFIEQVMQALRHDAPWLARAVEAFEAQLEIEQSAAPEAGDDDAAGKLALARALGGPQAAEGAQMLRVVSERLEARSRRRFSAAHIAARVAQLDEVVERARAEREAIGARAAALEA